MERNLYDDELEDFLKRKANQYKIYPSDKVWSGIYAALHTGRKWHILGGTLLLISILTLITLEKSVPEHTVVKKKPLTTAAVSNTSSTATTTQENTSNKTANSIFTLTAGKKWQPVVIAQEAAPAQIINENETEDNYSIREPKAIPVNPIAAATNKGDLRIVQSKITIPVRTQEEKPLNWLEEKAIIQLQQNQKNRSKLQFYLSPTISYRNLRSSTTGSRGIKALVDQAPALGLEIGSALQFYITDNFKIKTGLQLNYVRYNINAYRSSPEKTSITLSGAGYYSPPTTITTYSTFRNFNGSYPETIQNQYMQISMPVGAELKLLGGKRLQLNIAGSVQPTYLLMNSAYMLTSDYSNYIKQSSLVRKWNANASVETFISYKSGSLRWQVGPQFRYQLLSSYTDRYPISEHLMEYGMKIGVSKTINR